MDNSIFFEAFKAAGFLQACVYKPGAPAQKAFDAGWTQPDTLLLADEAQSTEHVLEFQTADLPALRIGDPITVAGVPFTVRAAPQKRGDGYFSTVALRAV